MCPDNILNDRYRSGAINLRDTRPVSQGRQEFETDPAIWPLNKPIPKIDALVSTKSIPEKYEKITNCDVWDYLKLYFLMIMALTLKVIFF